MACPWLLLDSLFLVPGAGSSHEPSGHKTLHELYRSNLGTTHAAAVDDEQGNAYIYPCDLAISSSSSSSYPYPTGPATLPFFRTVIVQDAPPAQVPVLDALRLLYLELGQFNVEYVGCFADIRPLFVVCDSPETAELVLQFLPGMARRLEAGFVGEIHALTSCWLERRRRIEAWSRASLWVSVEERDLRLRVRAVDDPFKEFQDLSWKFQGDCHHRSGENDQDKEGEVTLWVETCGTRKDFVMPPGKGKRPGKIPSSLKTRRTDGAIETIRSGIQNRLSEGRVVVGLRLVFTKVQDSKDFKRWLVSSLAVRNSGNDKWGREFEYPPVFQVSAMRRSRMPVPPLWSSQFSMGSQTKTGSSLTCDPATDPDHIVSTGVEDDYQQLHENSYQYCSVARSSYIIPTAHSPVVDINTAVRNTIVTKTTVEKFAADWVPPNIQYIEKIRDDSNDRIRVHRVGKKTPHA